MKKPYYTFILFLFLAGILLGQDDSYYNTINTSSASFITDLQNRIRSPYTKVAYDQFDETNVANFASRDTTGGQKVVTCVYSGQNYVYTPPFTWGTFSREHTWCHSWMPTYPSETVNEYSDQHHLFPTNQNNANGVRNNHPLGEVTTVLSSFLYCSYGKNDLNQNVFEPRESHKGDAARALLYMSLRYNGINGYDWTFNWLNNTRLPALNEAPQDLNTLLQWHLQDPPDKWEVERNDYIQSIQQNRNPFVDHPEYVNYINFNNLTKQSPTYSVEPSNFLTNFIANLNNDKTAITLTWDDAVAGSQVPQGYLFIAYDRDNYFIPIDGSVYTQDADLSDGKAVVYINYSDNNSYVFNDLNPNKYYYFTAYSYNGSGTTINYKIGGSAPQTSSYQSVVEPSAYPTGVFTNNPHYTGFTVNWTDATGTNLPDGYLILANTTGVFSAPVDGTVYYDFVNPNDGTAAANVSYSGSNSYTFNGLPDNTTYYIKIYSYAGSGSLINYKTNDTPPTATATTLLINEPTEYPSSINSSDITSTSFKINWTDATGAVLPNGYRILINTTGTFTNPSDGTTTEEDTDLSDGSGTFDVSFSDVNYKSFSSLTPSTTYYVKIYSYCGDNYFRNYKTDGTPPTATVTTSSVESYTVSLLDDFNRTNSSTLGNCALGFAWSKTETSSGLVSINNNTLTLKSYSTAGREFAYIPLSNITSYPTTLANATKLVTWSFNFRQSRSDPSGFDANNYGVAFVLAASTNNYNSGFGYAVVLGNSSSPDPIRLAYYNNGITNSNLTNLISSSTSGNNSYISAKVTFNPFTNEWSLYADFNSGSFIRTDTRLTNTLIGKITNSTYTNSNLPYLLLLYNHATGTSESSIFDDIYISNPDNMLPVELSLLEAIRINDKVILNWQTDTELNNLGFEIQKLENNNWLTVGFVNGKGNSNTKNEYSFTDINKNTERTAYRLKQLDLDGNFTYSQIVYAEKYLLNYNYILYQNYPNPFNPSTNIKFQIANDGFVTLKLYDILGNELQTLISEYKTKGEYNYTFNANNLANGVYIYTLTCGSFSQSKKMIIIK